MKIFIDTANLNEIRKAKALGLVDGVTTNPTLIAKEGEETESLIRKIAKEVKGPVNVEAIGMTSGEIVKEARVMAVWGEEIVMRQQTGLTPPGWLSRQRCRLMCRLGKALVSMGERLVRSSLPQPLSLKREMSRGS